MWLDCDDVFPSVSPGCIEESVSNDDSEVVFSVFYYMVVVRKGYLKELRSIFQVIF